MGSSGGGGSSGEVDFPDYMKTIHEDWLVSAGDTIDMSITEVMNNAMGAGGNPWSGATAYPVMDDIDVYMNTLDAFVALLAGIDERSDWNLIHQQAINSIGTFTELNVDDITAIMVPDASVTDAAGITDAEIVTDVDAFADQLDDEIANKILPRFRRGMQDINAVVSSAFPLGEACIEGFRNRDVARHASTLRLNATMKNADVDIANLNKDVQIETANMNKALEIAKANQGKDYKVGDLNVRTDAQFASMYIDASQQMLQYLMQKYAWELETARTTIEANRIKIVAMKEMTEVNQQIAEQDGLWDLEVFQHGANVLAAISGGTALPDIKKRSPVASAIGGGLAGAASGAMIGAQLGGQTGGYYGAAIGAILGAAAGLLSG